MFSEDPGKHGWCGVCIKSAKHPNSYGYCPDGADPDNDEFDLITRAKRARHWGFCAGILTRLHEYIASQKSKN